MLAFVSVADVPGFPRQKLFGFARTGVLEPGASQLVSIPLPGAEVLGVTDSAGHRAVSPSKSMRLRVGMHNQWLTQEMVVFGDAVVVEDYSTLFSP